MRNIIYINRREDNHFKADTSKIKVYNLFPSLNPYERIILTHPPTQILTFYWTIPNPVSYFNVYVYFSLCLLSLKSGKPMNGTSAIWGVH